MTFTSGALSDDIGQIYVQRHFPPETKAAADELVRNLVSGDGASDRQSDLDGPETKARARAKLANFTTKIGYPEQWRDYSGLEIRAGDAFGNSMRSAEFEHAYQIGKLGGPVRKWEWFMTPMTINAYANFNMSEIVFPAAILQPPFFDPNADPAINYGGIGGVIGHEISHHFDDQGAKYDEFGRLADWWTPNDLKAFGRPERRSLPNMTPMNRSLGSMSKGADTGREYRGPGRPHDRLRCVQGVAGRQGSAGHRRADR